MTDEVSEAEAEDVNSLRQKFTHENTTIVPDRGKVTITVDSTHPNEYAFTVSDADGNLLGDGVLTSLEFNIESFHINQQPDVPGPTENANS